jgi:hypothetical protein
MSGNREVTYALDFGRRKKGPPDNKASLSHRQAPEHGAPDSIPLIARLMALAIRLERLVRVGAIHDYAELSRLGRVTRARITQIMNLLDLAPDIQEQILFLPPLRGLTERNLRRIVSRIDWEEQRGMFKKITDVGKSPA